MAIKRKISLIGTGNIGSTLAILWAKAGHELFISSRHPETLQALASELGPQVRYGSIIEAAQWGDIVVESVPFSVIPELGSAITPYISGKIILDTANLLSGNDPKLVEESQKIGQGTGVWVSKHFPGAKIVKAFNTINFGTLRAEAHRKGELLGVPLASDYNDALAVAAELVVDAGFEPVVVGKLHRAKEFDVGTPPFDSDATAATLQRMLGLSTIT